MGRPLELCTGVMFTLLVSLSFSTGCTTNDAHFTSVRSKGGSTTETTVVGIEDPDKRIGQVRVTGESVKFRSSRVHKRVSIPFVYNYERGLSNRPLPWYLSLSAAGERIQLVRDLNQQVLDADEVFLDAIGTKNVNLETLLDFISDEREAAVQQVDDTREKFQDAQDEFDRISDLFLTARGYAARGETEKPSEDEIARAAAELVARGYTSADVIEAGAELDLSKKLSENPDVIAYNSAVDNLKGLDKLASTVIQNNIGQVNQRFTVFNMRPASLVASERNPVAYSVTDRKFLDSLDLSQAAMVAGTVIEPVVIVFGVVDSIAKRIIKKDGDTELHYFSIPVPYDFRDSLDADGNTMLAKSPNGDDEEASSTSGNRSINRVQIVVSNNGKYEYHINADDITSVKDGQIDWKSANEHTGELTKAVESDNEVYAAVVAANRDVRLAQAAAMARGNAALGVPAKPEALKVGHTKNSDIIVEAVSPSTALSDHTYLWTVVENTPEKNTIPHSPVAKNTLKILGEVFRQYENDVLVEARIAQGNNLSEPLGVILTHKVEGKGKDKVEDKAEDKADEELSKE